MSEYLILLPFALVVLSMRFRVMISLRIPS